jgi:hypothetical protein
MCERRNEPGARLNPANVGQQITFTATVSWTANRYPVGLLIRTAPIEFYKYQMWDTLRATKEKIVPPNDVVATNDLAA